MQNVSSVFSTSWWTDSVALYGSTTVSDTFGDGTIENVFMILSGYSSRIFEMISVPIPDPVPPPREWVIWNLQQYLSYFDVSVCTMIIFNRFLDDGEENLRINTMLYISLFFLFWFKTTIKPVNFWLVDFLEESQYLLLFWGCYKILYRTKYQNNNNKWFCEVEKIYLFFYFCRPFNGLI